MSRGQRNQGEERPLVNSQSTLSSSYKICFTRYHNIVGMVGREIPKSLSTIWSQDNYAAGEDKKKIEIDQSEINTTFIHIETLSFK